MAERLAKNPKNGNIMILNMLRGSGGLAAEVLSIIIHVVSAYNCRGRWWNAGATHMRAAVPTAWLRQHSLVSFLEEARWLQANHEPPDAERHVRWCGRRGLRGFRLRDAVWRHLLIFTE
jgi:hypothetical protein